MITVAIVDDHSIVRVGIKAIISTCPDMQFVGEHPGGNKAALFTMHISPDILLLDLRMPDKDGLTVLEEILQVKPNQKVIILTTSDTDNDMWKALKLGAKGYLLKDRDSGDIARAIRLVYNGGKFLPEQAKELYKSQIMPDFTHREQEILDYMAAGLSNDEIADKLGLKYESAKAYSKRIFAKLGVHDRVKAVTEALRRGFVRLSKQTPGRQQ